jgi:ABC-type branched-subunit amino acid transport system permease subunit
MVAGGGVAMLASLPIGALCFRLRGPYFAIATIATAQVLMLLFLKFRDFAWGAEGTTIPNLGNAPLMMQFDAKAAYYYIALGLLALGLAITWRIERSWVGYYLVAIGEDEDAAEAIGVNALRIKRDIYLVSAFLTALAGTFYVSTSTSSIRRPHSVSTFRLKRLWCRSSAASERCGVRLSVPCCWKRRLRCCKAGSAARSVGYN